MGSVLIVAGTDRDIVEYKSHAVFRNNQKKGLEADILHADEKSLADLLSGLQQSSLFGGGNFVWLKQAESLKNAELEQLKNVLNQGFTRNLLVSAVERNARGLSRWKAFEGIENVKVRIYSSAGDQLRQAYIKELIKRAKSAGKNLSAPDAAYLLEKCGSNLMLAVNELDKLCLYFQEDETITRTMIDRFSISSSTVRIFDFINSVLEGDGRAASLKIYDLLAGGEKPDAVFFILISTFSKFITAVTALKAGHRISEAAELAGLQEWQVRKYEQFASRWDWKELVDAFWKLLQYERELKTGRLRDESYALKKMIIELLLVKQA